MERIKVKKVSTSDGRRVWAVLFPVGYGDMNALCTSLPYAHSYAMYYLNWLRERERARKKLEQARSMGPRIPDAINRTLFG